jgi:hypothetical protein
VPRSQNNAQPTDRQAPEKDSTLPRTRKQSHAVMLLLKRFTKRLLIRLPLKTSNIDPAWWKG